ncbi:putative fatty-acid--CoA ligase fadD21 [Mycolicibacterium madagascariense]|uniref:Putative fatty-acid--CoA ligase fadD21 n=1 Tax=Mycolicibacterium madagascariense TaxID=212765 RepID=A0A7I7X987_9MYCO|nr:AMP-binding protein [Mycolicibacterium madagascariense]MCV7011892.1 AMP-binding protein [Mycolicibacterium madagascariense]BBZ26256.1 putative fatty-acid--CoA ligase fadD21 [Mycolicibacterium madagascariense]
MPSSSLMSLLRERAGLQPDDPAFTFTDYEADWDGITETLTWAQAYRRAVNVAIEVAKHGVVGDRAVILAPQGHHYVSAFLGATQAGRIAVPLSVPSVGTHDERVSAVFADTTPTVILTTSAVAPSVTEYVAELNAEATIISVDDLDLDGRNGSPPRVKDAPATAYLQYTSGSTRVPAGVMISERNLSANFEQLMADYFPSLGGVAPPETTIVSWLPFYHDMGLMLAVIAPILGGYHAKIMSPLSFLARPARWIQWLASNPSVYSAGPNFAFELAVRKTTDEDLAGMDLGDVLTIVTGSERVHPATLKRFTDRFAKFGFKENMITPSYGMAEATVYVSTRAAGGAPQIVDFVPEKLGAGIAERTASGTGSELISYGVPHSPPVRIVDTETRRECEPGVVGEIWTRGDNVSSGYWNKPEETERTFGGMIVDPSPGTPEGPWLRTGDLGFMSEGELFIVGRIKDLLIVYGRNHYAEDIEATMQEITGGRVAAISVDVDRTEKLVAIMEVRKRDDSEESKDKLALVKNKVTAAISASHGLNAADLVLVAPGSIPITTSGKVRRSTCVEQYRAGQFTRVDA